MRLHDPWTWFANCRGSSVSNREEVLVIKAGSFCFFGDRNNDGLLKTWGSQTGPGKYQ